MLNTEDMLGIRFHRGKARARVESTSKD
jgi:hypothetical protein